MSMGVSTPPPSEIVVDLYERHALAFDADRGRTAMEQRWLDRLLGLLPSQPTILDIGCGMAEPIAAYLIAQGCKLTGVDSAPSMLALCRQRFSKARWIESDMRRLALGEKFQGLVVWDSFFHLTQDDQRRMMPIFRAHAAPKAALLFTSGPRDGIEMGTYRGEPLFHASFAPDEYRALLSANGFDVIDFVPDDVECGNHSVWLAQAR